MEALCFSDKYIERIESLAYDQVRGVVARFGRRCLDGVFFVCLDGRVGYTRKGVAENDLISVLCNSRYPVLLRSQHARAPGDPPRWEVVTVAVIGGLMKGEAIYGSDALLP